MFLSRRGRSKGRLGVVEDHRSRSDVSRDHYGNHNEDVMRATIPVAAVVGRAFVLFWPLGRWDWLTVPETFDPIPAPAIG